MGWIIWLIIACEIGFWIFIITGLFARYILKKEKLGFFLLAMTPLVDLILLISAGVDMYRGATATIAHALAAIYIGVSIGFGKSMIEWADVRFKHYIAKTGPKPEKLYGLKFAKHNLRGWVRHVISYIIGAGLIGILYFTINDIKRTEALVQVLRVWTFVLVIDLIICITDFIFPKKPKTN